MTIQGKARFVLAAAAVLLTALAGHGWLQEHDARLKAESLSSAQQKQLDGLKQQAAETQQALAAKVAGIERERRQPATAGSVVRETGSLIPSLPVAIEAREVASALPNAPESEEVVIPQADFKAIRDAQLTCEEAGAKLAACQALQADAKQQIALTAAQRDEWKTAAKGGSVWHRALGAAKWFAVGAASGAVIYAAEHRK
jgi:hypothetical protein